MTTLVLELKKIQSDEKTLCSTFYLNSKAEIIIDEGNIDDVFELVYSTIPTNMQKPLGRNSGCIIDSVIDHNINVSEYNPLAGSSYIKLPKELDHPRKHLINIQNIDDSKCFKWCLVKCLHPADLNPARISKADKNFAKILYFKDIKFPVKTRDIYKIEKLNFISVRYFGYEIF